MTALSSRVPDDTIKLTTPEVATMLELGRYARIGSVELDALESREKHARGSNYARSRSME